MQRIHPCLWFDDEAEEAARFYVSIFRDSKILRVTHYPEHGREVHGKPAGSVLTVDFVLDGQRFLALNGGPGFPFTQAISLVVNCDDQREIDAYWRKLSDGGQEVECGWLKDRYGLSWQVVPAAITEMLADRDPARRDRVFAAIMTMKKLDLAALEAAYGKTPSRRAAAKRSSSARVKARPKKASKKSAQTRG